MDGYATEFAFDDVNETFAAYEELDALAESDDLSPFSSTLFNTINPKYDQEVKSLVELAERVNAMNDVSSGEMPYKLIPEKSRFEFDIEGYHVECTQNKNGVHFGYIKIFPIVDGVVTTVCLKVEDVAANVFLQESIIKMLEPIMGLYMANNPNDVVLNEGTLFGISARVALGLA